MRTPRIPLPRLTCLLLALMAMLLQAAPQEAAPQQGAPQDAAPRENATGPAAEQEIFSQVDEMLAVVTEITGFQARKPILRELITREGIRKLVETRLDEETTPEEIRLEELFLKKFGLVDPDFDLAAQMVDVLTEQAAALYDFKTKKLYLATWTSPDLREFSLVHELVHALQDQHFNLRKYVESAAGSDADLARMAVVEGQASWVMTEYVMRQSGRSLADNRFLAVAAAAASRVEAQEFPVFASTPLFLRETLLFPYTWGMLFQQSVVEKYKTAGFAEIFRRPPASSQQILDPEVYFAGRIPVKPVLPKVKLGRAYKKVGEGQVGQLEHSILIRKFIDEQVAKDFSPKWRGGSFVLLEPKSKQGAVLVYASEWEDAEAATRYFDLYKRIIQQKLEPVGFDTEASDRVTGRGKGGGFRLSRQGAVVTSIEGLPDDKLN
jgi:hypothetical protein